MEFEKQKDSFAICVYGQYGCGNNFLWRTEGRVANKLSEVQVKMNRCSISGYLAKLSLATIKMDSDRFAIGSNGRGEFEIN